MKRSRAISLLLMGSLAAGSAGCSSEKIEEGTYTFTSLNECVASAMFSESECRELAARALAETPRFSSQEECEAKFGAGACTRPDAQPGQEGTAVQQHSGGMWMPMMMGFMAGRFLGGGGMDAVVRHVEHLLDLGGDRTLALGGDLDGCDTLGGGITGVQDYPKLYAAIKARGYDAALLQDLFADNWLRVLPK